MIDIDIVCPIYKESATLENLVKSFSTQKGVNIKNIIFPVTLSHTEEDDVIRDIIKRYEPLVHKIVRQFYGKSTLEYDDLKSAANMGLFLMKYYVTVPVPFWVSTEYSGQKPYAARRPGFRRPGTVHC